jgi:hypothetical protein
MFNTNVITFKSINQLFVITVSDLDPHLVPSRFGRYKVVDEIILSSERCKITNSYGELINVAAFQQPRSGYSSS